ncbi:MAG: hypothetical protein RLZZ282_1148 [Verrucomicrobiota bacterium]
MKTKPSRKESAGQRAIEMAATLTTTATDSPATQSHAATATGRKLDAMPDRVDLRDWFYQPSLAALPDQIVNCDHVPEILDQGQQGACTGYALAAVINFHLEMRHIRRRASERMLYEMARRYDEWPGEQYEGSSARGAILGWCAHGVCPRDCWPPTLLGPTHLTPDRASAARGTPGGAYYRVQHRQVRDMHAALHETGILYCTLMVHAGWSEVGKLSSDWAEITYVDSGNVQERRLPIIRRVGRADAGHAIAIVGYTRHGFIIQNSWGKSWGADGFALLPYEDYLLHATDVWVVQLGVPVEMNLWSEGVAADTTAGFQRASGEIPLDDIRPYVIDISNNGELNQSGKYWSFPEDIERLVKTTIVHKTATWPRKRVLFYLHGGLNGETDVARRIVAMRDVCLANEIYPVHMMWESGAGETLRDIIADYFTDADTRAGGINDWMKKVRDGVIEAKDWSLELTLARPGTIMWNEMKENARLASEHADDLGGMQFLARYVKEAIAQIHGTSSPKDWEIHIVGHSAGSIFAAHAMRLLSSLSLPIASIHFLAPAITTDLFQKLMVPLIEQKKIPRPGLFIMSDDAERNDTVGPYGKSLLYLVSNAFEAKRGRPLLGMERFISTLGSAHSADTVPEIAELFKQPIDGLPGIVVAGTPGTDDSRSQSTSHGGFDNDVDTMNSLLCRILGKKQVATLQRPFTKRDLTY